MVESQIGKAKIYAMSGATMVVLTGAATVTMESADLTQDFNLTELPGQDGDTESAIGSDLKYNLTITFYPNGATRAAAVTSAQNSIAAPLTKVVLSGFSISTFNGDWNAMPGATIRLGNAAAAVQSIPLRAYITNRTSMTAGLISG